MFTQIELDLFSKDTPTTYDPQNSTVDGKTGRVVVISGWTGHGDYIPTADAWGKLTSMLLSGKAYMAMVGSTMQVFEKDMHTRILKNEIKQKSKDSKPDNKEG